MTSSGNFLAAFGLNNVAPFPHSFEVPRVVTQVSRTHQHQEPPRAVCAKGVPIKTDCCAFVGSGGPASATRKQRLCLLNRRWPSVNKEILVCGTSSCSRSREEGGLYCPQCHPDFRAFPRGHGMAMGTCKYHHIHFWQRHEVEGGSTAVHPTRRQTRIGNAARSASCMRPRRNVSGGLQFWPTVIMVHGERGRSEKNAVVEIKPFGVRCAQQVHCLDMLQGQILPRLVGDVFTPLILRGWLDFRVGISVQQRLVHVSECGRCYLLSYRGKISMDNPAQRNPCSMS